MNFVGETRKALREVETTAGVVPSRSVEEIEGMKEADEDEDEERERCWVG